MVNYSSWMKEVDDNTRISKLSIPGTHNSAACHTALPSVQCQGESISEQLEHGVRFLDIRAGRKIVKVGDQNELEIVHSKFPVRIPFPRMLKDGLEEVYDFLKSHPSETVIVSLKQEGSNDWNNDKDEFGNLVWDHYIDKNKDRWYLNTDLPRLGDARGKIVLFRRFGVRNDEKRSHYGFEASTWDYNTTEDDRGNFVVQDFCEIQNSGDISKKVKYVKDLALKAVDYNNGNDDKLFVNFTSGANFFDHDCWPQQVSEAMAKGGIADTFKKGTGVIVLDYIDADNWKLSKALVDKNF